MAKLRGVCHFHLLTASIKKEARKRGTDRERERVKQRGKKKKAAHPWWCGTAPWSTFLSAERQKNARPINQSQMWLDA